MQLSIIIINYKTPVLLLQCLKSIKKTISDILYEVIIVDNFSNDNSEERVIADFPEVVWIQKSENDGFGRANNIGIKHAKGEYILLLNSDIILLENTIAKCLNKIVTDKNIGVLGCKLLNADGTFQKSTYTGNGNATDILKNNLILDYIFKLHRKIKPVNGIMGAFMLLPKKVITEVGAFDPDFFMYSEEIDLCRRILLKGFVIDYYSDVSVIHKSAGSSQNLDWVDKQKYLSNALLHYKSYGIANYYLYHLFFHLNTITNFLVMWLLDKTYRQGFKNEQKYYYNNYIQYISIPFMFSRKTGKGGKLLRKVR